jgi:hypothetical protein
MKNVSILCLATLISGSVGFSQEQSRSLETSPLLLVQEIPLANVGGRIDHFTFDAKRKRVMGAALGNNTVEVVDTFSGRDEADHRVFVLTRRPARLVVIDSDSGAMVASVACVSALTICPMTLAENVSMFREERASSALFNRRTETIINRWQKSRPQ